MAGELHKIGLAAFQRCLVPPRNPEAHLEALEGLLWAKRGQLVTHDEIVLALWGDDAPDHTAQWVSERISQLRERLAPRRIVILNIRSRGYVMQRLDR